MVMVMVQGVRSGAYRRYPYDEVKQKAAGLRYYDSEAIDGRPARFRKNTIAESLGLSEYRPEAALNAGDGFYPEAGNLNYHKSGKKEGKDSIAVYDVLVSPNRTFQLLMAYAPDAEFRQRALAALEEMNEVVQRAVEEYARVRKTVDKKTAWLPVQGLASVSHLHGQNRRGDASAHIHNPTFRHTKAVGSDEWLTADFSLVMSSTFDLSARANKVLADFYRREGLSFELTRTGPELTCIPKDVLDALSNGRREMLEYARAAWGVDSLDQLDEHQRRLANLATRKEKVVMASDAMEEVHAIRLAASGMELHQLKGLIASAVQRAGASKALAIEFGEDAAKERKVTSKEAVARAVAALTDNDASIESRAILIAKSMQMSSFTLDAEEVKKEIDQQIATGELIFRHAETSPWTHYGFKKSRLSLTTKEILIKEREVEQWYSQTALKAGQLVANEVVDRHIENAVHLLGGSLTRGQEAGVRAVMQGHAVEEGKRLSSTFTVWQGSAGVGKTASMKTMHAIVDETNDVAESMGKPKIRLVGMAPSDKAVKELRDAGFKELLTVQNAVRNERFWREVDSSTVIVVDEAGMADLDTLHELMKRVMAARDPITGSGPRMVFVGDHQQVKGVRRGDPFKQLVDLCGKRDELVKLDEMRRAKTEEMKRLHVLSRDDQRAALVELSKMQQSWIAIEDKQQRINRAVEQYLALNESERAKTPVIVDTNADRLAFVKAVKERTAATRTPVGAVDAFEAYRTSPKELSVNSAYGVGDEIKMVSKSHPFSVGDSLRVLEIHGDQKLVVERFNRAKGVGERMVFDTLLHGASASLGFREKLQLDEGDVLRFTGRVSRLKAEQGGSSLTAKNGDFCRVVGLDKKNKQLIVDLLEGGTVKGRVRLSTEEPLPLQHAIAGTVHSYQGGTYDRGIYITSKTSTSMNNFYVAITRFKHGVTVLSDARTQEDVQLMMREVTKAAHKTRALAADDRRTPDQPFTIWDGVKPISKEDGFRVVLLSRKDVHQPDKVLAALLQAREKFGAKLKLGGQRDEDKELFKAFAAAAAEARLDVEFVNPSAQKALQAAREHQQAVALSKLRESSRDAAIDITDAPESVRDSAVKLSAEQQPKSAVKRRGARRRM